MPVETRGAPGGVGGPDVEGARVLARLKEFLARLDLSDALFGLRTTIAALAALWIAMLLQFETPRWAAWTVMSLALPSRGLVASKGLWRAGGTVLGLVAGIVGVALFAQNDIAMGLFLSTWFALAAYVGGRIGGMASYGAALAVLTTGLLAVMSEADPLSSFYVAMARGADIFLGVACAYVVSALSEFFQGPAPTPAPPAAPSPAAVVGNAVRVFVTVGLAWAAWMATAWSEGGIFVVFAGVIVLVFMAAPDADRRSLDYVKGVAIGQGLGLVVKYALLASSNSFGFLAAILAPCLFIGAVGMKDPRCAATAVGFNLAFLLAVDPANPAQYDLAASLNEALGIFAGVAVGLAAYRLVLPSLVWRTAA